jgi:hypothetical protein
MSMPSPPSPLTPSGPAWVPPRAPMARDRASLPHADRPGPRPNPPGNIGVVRDLKERSETVGGASAQQTEQVRTFRVERYDATGNRLAPITVEMRGQTLWGVVNEGDSVEIPASWTPDHTLSVAEMTNLTTGSRFGATLPPRHRWMAPVFLIVILSFASAAVGLASSGASGPSPVAELGVAGFVASLLVLMVGAVGSGLRAEGRRRRSGPTPTHRWRLIVVGVVVLAVVGVVLGLELSSNGSSPNGSSPNSPSPSGSSPNGSQPARPGTIPHILVNPRLRLP